MDKNKAIVLLKECLLEITQLKNLPLDNQEYPLWRDKVLDILEERFGKQSIEWERFARARIGRSSAWEPQQEDYISEINMRETALKSIIQKSEMLGIEIENENEIVTPPKAFIVHGGKSGVLDKLCDYIEALGIKPLIVEMLPSKGMLVADKVKKYQQEADCAIVLATRGGIIDSKSGKQHPRLNVIDELSYFYEAFPERVIVLLEKGAELPSNKAALTYETFARQSMDRAFSAIARELVEMRILKAVKPETKE
jgi:predicted nucleotide-binding protein